MQVIVGMATMPGRELQCRKAIDSLKDQCNAIFLYDNGLLPDLTDNGKFYGLIHLNEPVYYLTADDDLIYPSDYVDEIKQNIERTGGIVTYNGRRLLGKDRSYYYGHATYRFNTTEYYSGKIDVPGTGVMGFRTDYFNPVGIHAHELQRMSDLVFAREAHKAQKDIYLIPHKDNRIVQQRVTESIRDVARLDERKHIEIANEIYELRANK